MAKDEEVVQEEKASTEETTSKETETKAEEKGETKAEEKSTEQPFSTEQEARIQQMVSQASTEATKTAVEAGRRQLQGEQDRNRNAESRARLAESRVKGYETSLSGLDEETQKDIELARLREQDKHYQSNAQDEEQRRQQATQIQQMNDSLTEEVKIWGIEPNDKRIDYASDAPDYFTGRKRFTDSLQKIVNAKQQEAGEKQAENLKNLETKLRKDLGLDSVDTTTGSGGGSDSDAEFKKGLGDGSLPLNKTNMARAKKLGIA
ncbi:hypothetical protein LCGC14_0572280 [marine sediment metagenome]|uniref:Scaffolding protein n=1 Tax=marine sediment metagenome TaxID=412755 RepID=A0A0F9RIZ5_9ZZZZ